MSNATISMMLLAALVSTAACESDDRESPSTPVPAEEVEVREKAGLHPADRIDPDPQTAEQLKGEIGLHSEGKKPKSVQEMREEMDLHPERVEDAGR